MKEKSINIKEIIGIIKNRYKVIITITLLFTLTSIILNFFIIKHKYEIKTKFFIGKDNSKVEEYNSDDIVMYQRLLLTYAEIFQTDDLIQRALNKENLKIKVKDVKENLKVIPRDDTQILEVIYKGTDKFEILNTIRSITYEFIKESNKLISNGNIQVIECAKLPNEPLGKNKFFNVFIPIIIGFIVSFILSLILEFMDNTYKSRGDVEDYLCIPVIGVIPKLENYNLIDNNYNKNN